MKNFILALFIIFLPFQLRLPQMPFINTINLFLFLLIIILIASKNPSRIKLKFMLPLCLFLCIWFGSFIHSLFNPSGMWLTSILIEFKRLFTLVLAYFVFANSLKTKKEVNFLFGIFIFTIFLVGLHTWRNGMLAGENFADFKRSSGPFAEGWKGSDIAGGFLAIYIPFIIATAFFLKKIKWQILCFFCLGVSVLGILTTYSRGSILALAVAFITIILFNFKYFAKVTKLTKIALIFILFIGAFGWKIWVPKTIVNRAEGTVTEDSYQQSQLDESSQGRLAIWSSGMEVFKGSPIFGAGFRMVQNKLGVDPHSAFILILAEMGIIGFLIFLWFLVAVFKEALALLNTEFIAIGMGFIGLIVAFCIVNMFYANFFRDTVSGSFWVILGILAAAKKISKQNKANVTDTNRASKTKIKLSTTVIILFVSALFNFTTVFAETNNRWWNQDEVKSLNVLKDFKAKRVGLDLYVDGKTGDDNKGNGTMFSPWKTIGKGVDSLSPGDRLAIASGVYRERLFIKKNGTEDNRIIIGPSGDGEVIIDSSGEITDWIPYKNGIYKAVCKFKPTAVVVDDKPLFPVTSFSIMNEDEWYHDAGTSLLYLCIKNKEDPTSHGIGVISDDGYQDGVLLNDASNITLYGLTIRCAGGRGISILGRNNRVEKCNVKFNGGTGINVFNYKEIVSDNTQIIKNNIYHNFLRNWPRGRYKWGSWGSGAGSQGTPNIQYIGNIVHKNGGEGLLAYGGSGGTIFRDNIVYNNWSVNIYVDNQPNSIIDKNLIFSQEPDLEDLNNNGDTESRDGKNLRRLRPEGIMTADEKYDLNPPANLSNITISNNIIIGCRRGITHYGQAQGSGLKNVLVVNNTIIVPGVQGIGEDFIGINVPYNNGNNNNTFYTNNIVFASHPSTYLLNVETGANNDFHGVAFRNNLWFHRNRKNPFHLGPKFLNIADFAGWQKKCTTGKDCSAGLYSDPLFINTKTYSADSLKLQPGSPAIGAGIIVKDLLTDYYNNKRPERSPTIGAIEFIKSNE